ncbi:hypothetical protein RIB2604_01808110 [Aspergillus luchuensis]|uniref:Uncharacterized protein n=1 Tax=Aspergillus kawachii TaxID=1069201 RepID=A0A146FGH1_ASPKA|nr:hypothetical protein RIB2604_01808110 [Aspergillus luchuensis]
MPANLREGSTTMQTTEWREFVVRNSTGCKVTTHITETTDHETNTSLNRQQALFETTKRVLATGNEESWMKCGLRNSAYVENNGGEITGFLRADDLLPPVLTQTVEGEISEELDPGAICHIICLWQREHFANAAVETLVKEVRNSTDNQALSTALRTLLPQDLWIFEDAASITGGQDDFDKARHLTCIIRKSPEMQAEELGETIIPVAGLFQKPYKDNRTYMEIMFGLDDPQKKQTWLRKYCPTRLKHGLARFFI